MTTAELSVSATVHHARNRPFRKVLVADVQRLCDDAAAITFAVPARYADEFHFAPGQSVTVRRMIDGVEQRRSYSICAPVGSALRIGVREVPGGVFSGWLVHELSAGDEIELQPPSGHFAADPQTAAHHLLIAAGSGITPVLSIAASALAHPDSRVTLIYGNRRSATVMFADELADLKDAHCSRLQLIHVLSREARTADLFSGRLDPARIRSLLEQLVGVHSVDHAWLCGPLGMVTGASQVLGELGFDTDRVHRELFFVDDAAPSPVEQAPSAESGPRSDVTVVLEGAESTIVVPRDIAILDGAQRFRDDLPFACKGGVCGTCRAKVTDGAVDMRRNYALESGEVDAGFVLTCQSYPLTESLTVDFDA
ncbi:1,2-phenylacetyl-CoA epoxidase subunit PaaE [Mycolicibacterium confluentis]|uniref:Putative phenylacetic acid degradation protein PaaE/phenylacetate-CoA oxygenase/reductase, PaaK subunit n=1 Tax=Mycolicibacterium confluentis TaxID=28047 RepID=A0A7I7Y3R8_9MYCO|nr:1,2-phenylacetyl-CoA epoxidase subunit PaaE [Mycolicibacterium confluentis]MCV7320706.1 phenylacetate-CoA oxygenase/reductase subunit PaaK [Mycolicibacterium confluentis]ORV30346.1 phenylacetic acid degradation protein [Mycolicibacterium confluentis]BBZ35753.1 putative phenylacetic acid degradation protein PaaE/phenylacetate-CoA oxygenase/reductase, PaaK subunit [Mycolicibacterium confluentis]